MQVASKKVYWKKQQSVPNTCHISPLKKFFQNRCIFQISLMYIKLAIPKILFILVLCNFNFNFKTTWPLPIWKFLTTHPSPPPPCPPLSKNFSKIINLPSPPWPNLKGRGCMPWISLTETHHFNSKPSRMIHLRKNNQFFNISENPQENHEKLISAKFLTFKSKFWVITVATYITVSW